MLLTQVEVYHFRLPHGQGIDKRCDDNLIGMFEKSSRGTLSAAESSGRSTNATAAVLALWLLAAFATSVPITYTHRSALCSSHTGLHIENAVNYTMVLLVHLTFTVLLVVAGVWWDFCNM